MKRFPLTLQSSSRRLVNLAVNCVPQFKMMSAGRPWSRVMSCRNSRAVSFAVTTEVVAEKCAILVNLFT